MAHLLLSAAHKSSGKTTVSLGLCRALAKRGLIVQPFKKGPDYIDPMWLGAAAGRACRNLDYFTQGEDEIRAVFAAHAADADIAVIEGNKGLYDGLHLDGSTSNAALATLLGAPVVLVIDARGMTRGIAPLILGYQAFDPRVRIAGVILNKIGGSRHEAKLRAIIEHYTEVKVLGAVQASAELEIVERHLGLIPSNESADAMARIDTIAEAVGAQVDLDGVIAVARTAAPSAVAIVPRAARPAADLRIAVAKDSAFGFYYADDLDALVAAGAEPVFIDTMHDLTLPPVDGLFIGGGFPETHMVALEGNVALRTDIREAIEGGLPAYAECGGLMYLCRSISWQGLTCEMSGVLPADVLMHERPSGRGYVRLRETAASPWPALAGEGPGFEFPAHEFHYSSLEQVAEGLTYAYDVTRGTGIDGMRDGIVHKNLLACYSHLRDTARHHWVARFVAFVRARKEKRHD